MPDQRPENFTIHIGGSVSGQVVGGHHNIAEFRQVAAAENATGGETRTAPEPDRKAIGHTIVVADVQESGRFNSRQQSRMRAELLRIFQDGTTALELSWDELHPSDRGDGVRLVFSLETVPLPKILNVFLPAIADSVREHVAASDAAVQLKLRVAVHFGFLDRVDGAWSGEPLVHVVRLVDCQEAKRILGEARSHLAVIISGDVHQKFVKQGHTQLDPAAFRRIHITEQETSTDAWIHLPLE